MTDRPYRPPSARGWHFEIEELDHVMQLWGVTDYSATPNVMLSRVNSTQTTRAERAVTLTFVKDGRTVTLPMDDYDTASLNLKVLRLCVEDMRMLERRGVQQTMQSAYLQLAGPQGPVVRDPHEVLGLRPGASAEMVNAVYRALSKNAHPDHGGDPEAFKELTRARDRLIELAAAR